MTQIWKRIFVNHPQSIDESYLEHFVFALWFASRLLGAGFAELVHAITPCFFEKTASNLIIQMHEHIANRGR